MKKQRKTILLTMNGKFPKKGSIVMEKKITPYVMGKIIMTLAETEEEQKQFNKQFFLKKSN